ncbi:thiamine phosphate synthase [Halobacteria archaeon AArc-curdl1]|uniref:Thiamine-phosphate synthase n=1 Tax=Natronosalvus hydrolyticus TaxID=2979988 RepID=A0AAP2ZA54_9EURY|nr:thiamine phosphate synthase [Halobacteria archaeon AArc-curdl1]
MHHDPANWQTYLVTQESASNGRRTPEIVERALEGGIDVVQLREKGLDARDRYEVGRVVRELTAEADVPLIVNDRIDLARALGADGVHVGQSDLPVAVARDLLGESAIVGCSVSTVEESLDAERAGASYLGVGAVYGTTSKSVAARKDGIGTERIEAIVDAVDIPVIGIGGITDENARPVVDAGGTGVAVISEITAADDPASATETLVETVDGQEKPPE